MGYLCLKPSFTVGSLLPSAHLARGCCSGTLRMSHISEESSDTRRAEVGVSASQFCAQFQDNFVPSLHPSPAPSSQSSPLARALCPAEGGTGGSCCPRGSRKLCHGRTLDRSLTWSSCSLPCPCSTLCQQLFPPQQHHRPCRHSQGGLSPCAFPSLFPSWRDFDLEQSQLPRSPTR